MSNQTRTYLLIEERLGKDLADYVIEDARKRDGGSSWNAVALDLYTKTAVSVTSETLRMWFAGAEKDANAHKAHVA